VLSVPATGHNEFGRNIDPGAPLDELCAALGISEGHRVLDVGGAGNAFKRADVVCDLTFASCAQRNGAPGVLRADVQYVEAPVEQLPFADGEFHFVWCAQVLEHVADPEAACRELARVARRGFVEVPSRLGELTNGNPTHRWLVDMEGDTLVFHPRPFLEHPLKNTWYGLMYGDRDLQERSETTYRNLFNHQLMFEGSIPCRVEPAAGPAFRYDDPEQAGRAHYSFARNVLLGGADAAYVLPDALEAVRLLPRSRSARLLLASNFARMLRFDEALAAIDGLTSDESVLMRSTIQRLADGHPQDLQSVPVPGPDPGELTLGEGGLTRPRVTVIVAGHDPAGVLASLESALTQDYDPLEVVVSTSADLSGSLDRLSMGDRLRVLSDPKDTPLADLFNAGARAAQGDVMAFVIAGDRPMAHHVERCVTRLMVSGASAVHTDRLLVGGGVAGPDIIPGDPATAGASLSTVIARSALLEEVGYLDQDAPDAPLDYLVRLARTRRLEHLEEATIHSPHPVPSGVGVLQGAHAGARMRALELHRSLIAATEREDGLKGRIRQLEDRVRELEEGAS